MDIFAALAGVSPLEKPDILRTVDMHTSGEPTRIVVAGYPELHGETLLEKRAYARKKLDDIRTRLMWEPRGHRDMYGAILVAETELTASGEADIGVLFMHNEGYSTMCGHATIALGRFLVDTQDTKVFPRRKQLAYDAVNEETTLRLHAPCGAVEVKVPIMVDENGITKSDPSRPVDFLSVESFVNALDVVAEIEEAERWPALRAAGRARVTVDIAYGGAYYAFVSAQELGFTRGIHGHGLDELSAATKTVKRALAGRRELFEHPSEGDLEYLYGVIVTEGATSVCFFADQEVDRSPTGSGVSARVALGITRGTVGVGEEAEYESVLTARAAGNGFRASAASVGTVVGRSGRAWTAARVRVGGRAWYTGVHVSALEAGDRLGTWGFVL